MGRYFVLNSLRCNPKAFEDFFQTQKEHLCLLQCIGQEGQVVRKICVCNLNLRMPSTLPLMEHESKDLRVFMSLCNRLQ